MTALWQRIKGMGATAALVGTAILLALAGARAVKRKSSAKRKESLAVDLQNTAIQSNIDKASALIESANLDKQKAHAAKAKIKQHLESLGKNPDIDAIAAAHNRLRDNND